MPIKLDIALQHRHLSPNSFARERAMRLPPICGKRKSRDNFSQSVCSNRAWIMATRFDTLDPDKGRCLRAQ
jgi:hypothetical protein